MFIVSKPAVARWHFNHTLVVRRNSIIERIVLAIPLTVCDAIGLCVMRARIGNDMTNYSEIGLTSWK